jgi:hypothetical protein
MLINNPFIYIIACMAWMSTGFGLVIGFIKYLQLATTRLWFYTVYNSIWYALTPPSLLCLYQPSDNSFQRHTFSFWIPELYPWLKKFSTNQLWTTFQHWQTTIYIYIYISQSNVTADGQSVSISWCQIHSGTCDQIFSVLKLLCCLCGAPLWREVGSVSCQSVSSI